MSDDLPASVGARRRLIQHAIRTEAARPPAGLEELAERVALRQAGLRWFVLLYAIGFVVEVVSFALEDSLLAQLRDAALALVFVVLAGVQSRSSRRAREAYERWAGSGPGTGKTGAA